MKQYSLSLKSIIANEEVFNTLISSDYFNTNSKGLQATLVTDEDYDVEMVEIDEVSVKRGLINVYANIKTKSDSVKASLHFNSYGVLTAASFDNLNKVKMNSNCYSFVLNTSLRFITVQCSIECYQNWIKQYEAAE